jgi:predicted secreted protein
VCTRKKKKKKGRKEKKHLKKNPRTKTSWQLDRGEKKGKNHLGNDEVLWRQSSSNKSVRE